MRFIRFVLGKIILFLNALFSPRSLQRPPEKQTLIDHETRNMVLYQFDACPFCVKVRRAVKRLNLKIELKDATEPKIADELLKGGGELQVPCLRIADSQGAYQWMYESSDIIKYLTEKYRPLDS